MNADEVKEYIINNNLIKELLTKLNCHSFIEGKNLRCALPNDDDPTKVSIDTNTLYIRIYTKAETIKGNIYELVMYLDNCSFAEAFKKICFLLNLDSTYKNKSKIKRNNPIDLFVKLKKHNDLIIPTQKYYDLSILDNYSNIPHIELIKKDGIISQYHINKYQIKFDERTDRIVFPHFKYDNSNLIAGLVGRTVKKAYKELKISKYLSLLDTDYEKKYNLYALSHNIKYIKEFGIVVVFEAEKSVIKADMFRFPIGVAVGSHDISYFQQKLLIGLDVEICIAFDNDIDIDYIKSVCKRFYNFRKVSYIKDKWNLLQEKDSPVDRGHKRWEFLFKNRTIYKGA